MDTRTKSEIYPFPGPLTAFPPIVFPFPAVSIQVTNNTTRQLFLHKTHVPASISEAIITVEPRMLYNIQGWLDIHMFIGIAAPLIAGEYVTLQVSDQFNPAPAALMIESPIPTGAAGDAIGNPTTGQEITFSMVYDSVNLNWNRLRQGRVDGAGLTIGLEADVPHAWDSASGSFTPLYNLRTLGDGNDGTRNFAVGSMFYDTTTGLWFRFRSSKSTGDGADGTGHISTGLMLLNPAATWDRIRASDPSGAIISAGIQAMHHHLWDSLNARFVGQAGASNDGFGTPTRLVFAIPGLLNAGGTVDRARASNGDGVSSLGVQAVGSMVYNALAGTYDRLIRAHSALQSLSGMQAMQPYLSDGNAGGPEAIWRGASAPNVATADGRGVAQVVEPGHWTLRGIDGGGTSPASQTRAAVAGTRHVLRTISARFFTPTVLAGGSSVTVLVVRDGASGVGTILWQSYFVIATAAASEDRLDLSGLSLVGSVNTAMTVEFTVLATGTQQSLSATGYEAT